MTKAGSRDVTLRDGRHLRHIHRDYLEGRVGGAGVLEGRVTPSPTGLGKGQGASRPAAGDSVGVTVQAEMSHPALCLAGLALTPTFSSSIARKGQFLT